MEQNQKVHEDNSDNVSPQSVSVLLGTYRRLIEFRCREERIGNLIIGSMPLKVLKAVFGEIEVVIDELLGDTEIVVS